METSSHLNNICTSVLINYKSWICFIFSISIIKTKSFLIAFSNLILFMIYSHILHFIWHLKYIYPINIIHTYHHSTQNMLSHISEIVMECVLFTSIIAPKYVINHPLIPYIDEWVIFFGLLWYITVHNINYSILRVNDVHKIHHEVLEQNMGPDICDVIFNTKYKPELGLENTDHYIPNIIIITIVIKLLQYLWNHKHNNKKFCHSVIEIIIYLSGIFLWVVSVMIHFNDIVVSHVKLENKINHILQMLPNSRKKNY